MVNRLYGLIIVFILWACQVSAQNIDSISYVIDSTYKQSPFYGNLLITKNGKTIFEKSYGNADAVNGVKLTSDNSFQVASISKQFTAYGILLLHAKGALNYDDKVSRYIPGFPYDNITIRHLLTHTSGLPDFWDGIRPYLDTTKANGNKEVLEYLIKHKMPLQFEPGSQLAYADIGYDFLANIIENRSYVNYQEFMEQNIFKPLKMKNTYAYMVTDIRKIKNKHLAKGHVYQGGKFEYAHTQPKYNFVYYLGDFYGDGSVVTSARDLARWDRALKNYTLLPAYIQDKAFKENEYSGQIVRPKSSPEVGYGFGWFIKNISGKRVYYHTGGHPGNVHVIYRIPEKDMAFIFLSNAETPNLRGLRNRILELLLR